MLTHWLEFTPQRKPLLDYRSAVYAAGSCFAVHLGDRLKEEGFDIQRHPFGIVYSPWALLRQFERLLEGRLYNLDDLHCQDEVWFSYDHHSDCAGTNPHLVLENINGSLETGSQVLKHAGLLLLTFGSARTFCLAGNGTPVANCHRSPASTFIQNQAEPAQMIPAYLQLIRKLRQHNPSLKIVLTVSPVRHLREGLEQNNRSKARLFLLVEALCAQAEGVYYFPAYECLLDVLRDYRWYADDLAHPSAAAVKYICDAFMQACATDESREFSRRVRAYLRDAAHRPRFPETGAFQRFQENMDRNKELLLRDYPELAARGFFAGREGD